MGNVEYFTIAIIITLFLCCLYLFRNSILAWLWAKDQKDRLAKLKKWNDRKFDGTKYIYRHNGQ